MKNLGLWCLFFGVFNLIWACFPPVGWQVVHVIVGAACTACFFDSLRCRR